MEASGCLSWDMGRAGIPEEGNEKSQTESLPIRMAGKEKERARGAGSLGGRVLSTR